MPERVDHPAKSDGPCVVIPSTGDERTALAVSVAGGADAAADQSA